MKKYIVFLSGIALLSPIFVGAQTETFSCPIDWNCFPKTITACPIGYFCQRYSDGFRIDTDTSNVSKIENLQPIIGAAQIAEIEDSRILKGEEKDNKIKDLTSKMNVLRADAENAHHSINDIIRKYAKSSPSWSCNSGVCANDAYKNRDIENATNLSKYFNCQADNIANQIGRISMNRPALEAAQADCDKLRPQD